MRALIIFVISTILIGCAGYSANEIVNRGSLPQEASYMVFPFKNPSLNGKSYSGVGSRFTQEFSKSSSKHGYDVIQASSREFPSSRDLDLEKALEYARRKGADYIVVGQVTKWVDRATEWNFKRDFAGLSVTSYDVFSGKLIRSIDIDQHSNNFYSGTPDDYVRTLSKKAAEKLYSENL